MITLKLSARGLNLYLRRSKPNSYIACWARNKSYQRTPTQVIDDPMVNRIDELENHDKCLFPMLNEFNITSNNGIHTLSTPCMSILKFIWMGGINKNLSAQYSHYLNHLCRTATENTEVYSKASIAIVMLLIKQDNNGFTDEQTTTLIGDCATSSRHNCIKICELIKEKSELVDTMPAIIFNALLYSCYKFSLWELASDVVELRKIKYRSVIHQEIFDKFIEYAAEEAKVCKNSQLNQIENEKKKQSILNHFYQIIELSYQNRILFATKHTQKYVDSLRDLGVDVTENVFIKMSGKCTTCCNKIPLYNSANLKEVNSSIKTLLGKKLDDQNLVHASSFEVKKFENFLRDMFESDGKPIDCVIDALNLAYSNAARSILIGSEYQNIMTTRRISSEEDRTQVFINTLIRNDVLKKFKKILVIGRKHQQNWPGLTDFLCKFKIHYYWTQNDSSDDLFTLYAATLNPHTVLISNDSFRSYSHVIDHSYRINLSRWLDTHQAGINRKTLLANWPTPYEKLPTLDRHKGRFHLPIIDFERYQEYTVSNPVLPVMQHQMFMKWLCCHTKPDLEENKAV